MTKQRCFVGRMVQGKTKRAPTSTIRALTQKPCEDDTFYSFANIVSGSARRVIGRGIGTLTPRDLSAAYSFAQYDRGAQCTIFCRLVS